MVWFSSALYSTRYRINRFLSLVGSRASSQRYHSQEIFQMAEEEEMQKIKEGKAEAFYPKSVFYNPVQEFNRDLTVAVISEFARSYLPEKVEKFKKRLKMEQQKQNQNSEDKNEAEMDEQKTRDPEDLELKLEAGVKCEHGLRVLEGLSASGLRSMRYAREIPGIKEIICNDFDETAVKMINKNIVHNQVENLVTASCDDAAMVMYKNRKFVDRFDVIDLDPYGGASPFLDATVQAVRDGGLLCITCTDTGVLCGNGTETCYSKYGAVSLRTKYCHEMGLRILLQSIESHANRYSRYIVPVLSMSADFYVRVFVRVYTGQKVVKNSFTKLGMVYSCTGCGSFSIQKMGRRVQTTGDNFKYLPGMGPPVSERCEHCNEHFHIGGPIWTERMHDQEFIQRVLDKLAQSSDPPKTSRRIKGMLTVMKEELPDQPLYYVGSALSNVLHCFEPRLLQIRSALLNAGYEVSLSHCVQGSIKTNAPNKVIWDIMRCWVKDHPVREERLVDGTPTKAILSQPPELTADFTEHPEANPESRKQKLVRYQVNPTADWGPKPRAKPATGDMLDKRKQLQGKRKRKMEALDLKKFRCKRFKRGDCTLGEKCRYSHELDSCDYESIDEDFSDENL